MTIGLFRACRAAALLAVAAVAGVMSVPAFAERATERNTPHTHVALVIANSAYRRSQGYTRLYTPRRDAELVKDELEALGYHVILKRDLMPAQMYEALSEFAELADSAEVAMAYYAGHGVSHQNINYLVPILGMRIVGADIPRTFVSADALAEAAAAAEMGVVVWDACREDAPVNLTRGVVQDLEEDDRGAIVTPPAPQENVVMMYSTSHEQVASDGPRSGNSPFAAAFAEALQGARETPLASLFQQVTQSVLSQTHDVQKPVSHADLNFANHKLAPEAPAAQAGAPESPTAHLSRPRVPVMPPAFDLQAALDSARPGAQVRVPDGVYQGPFTITRPVQLIGESKDGTIITSTNTHPALIWNIPARQYRSSSPRGEGVYNLSLRSEATDSFAAMHVQAGAPVVGDVDVQYQGLAGVRVSQPHTGDAPAVTTLQDVSIAGVETGEQIGVHVDQGAYVDMRGGQTFNSKYGLYAAAGAQVRVFGSDVHENGWGAVVYDGSDLRAYDNASFKDNEYNGIYAQGGKVCLERVRISGNNRAPNAAQADSSKHGVYVNGDGASLMMTAVQSEQDNSYRAAAGVRFLRGMGCRR